MGWQEYWVGAKKVAQESWEDWGGKSSFKQTKNFFLQFFFANFMTNVKCEDQIPNFYDPQFLTMENRINR